MTSGYISWDTWRCSKCRRILAKHKLAAGSHVEIKCPHCNVMNVLAASEGPTADDIAAAMMTRYNLRQDTLSDAEKIAGEAALAIQREYNLSIAP